MRSGAMIFMIGLAVVAPVAEAADRPNVLVIHCDELNFRTLGCYRKLLPTDQAQMWGPTVVGTPHLDALAAQGAICTRFYATTPLCSPSRSALMSGDYPQNTPVVSNNIPMRPDVQTFAEVLRRAGYATGYAGKWHLDGMSKPGWAPKRKFGFEDNRYMFNRGHWKKLELTADGPRVAARSGGGNGKPNYSVAGADEKSYTTDFLCDRAIEFIEQHRSGPWCYMVSLPDPHNPDTVRAPYDTMYAGKTYTEPRTFNQPARNRPVWASRLSGFADMAGYYGMVKCIDDNVGKIIHVLRRDGLIDRTIIVFTADHGDMRGEHHLQNKGVPYEASARIPFIVYARGVIRPGTVVGQALTCVDFKSTILALAGLTPTDSQGRDASALLRGEKPATWPDVAFMRGPGRQNGWVAAVTARYKLIYSTTDPPYLFDLEKDPDELQNRFTDPASRQTVRTLSEQLAVYGKRYNDPRVTSEPVCSDLDWAIHGDGPYVNRRPKVPTPAISPKPRRRKSKQINRTKN